MAAPPIIERHKHHFHRQSPIKESVRAATTADITIATALNNGDSLDGVTLATGDRVLVKDQGTGSQNGIYVVGASPARDYDVSTDDPAFGYLVLVREGTANAGKLFKNTNTTAPTIGTTAITFEDFGSGGALTVEEVDGTPSVSPVTTIVLPNGTLTDDGGGQVTYTPATPGSTVDIEDEGAAEGAADTIDFTGAGVSVTFAAGTATVNIPGGGGSGALTFLDQEVLGSAAADITITGISGSYKDLVVVISTKSAISGDGDWLYMQVGNGSIDTGSNYRYIRFFAGGSGTGTTVSTGDSKVVLGSQPGGNSTAGMFGHAVVEFPEYSTTTGSRKRGWVFNTSAVGGAEFLSQFGGGSWNNTAAIDQIKIYAPSNNLIAGSTVTIYGRT